MVRGAVVAALATAALASLCVAAGQARVVWRSSSSSAAARFWTPQRMARARPLQIARGERDPVLKRAPVAPPFDSLQVPDPTASPLSAHGKLFGRLAGFGAFECSATVLDTPSRSVVITAGHCVYEPRTRAAATKLAFVPAYTDRARPFGRWSASASRTTQEWIKRGNFDYDYATLTMRPLNGVAIEDAVGGRPLLTESPRETVYNSFGYPVNHGRAQLEWTCRGPYAGDDPHPVPGGPPPIGMGCDMKEGASGGGWINDLGELVSVTSFGYPSRPGFLYGPFLTSRAAALVARSG